MSPMIDLSSFAQWSSDWAELALQISLRGSLLLAAIGLLTVTMRRAAAATRHLMWTLGVVGLLALPLAMIAVPAWEVTLPQTIPTWSSPERQPLSRGELPLRSVSFEPETTAFPTPATESPQTTPTFAGLERVTDFQNVPFEAAQGAPSMWDNGRDVLARIPATGWMLFAWETGFLLVLLVMAVGLTRLWWLSRKAQPLWTPEWTALVDTLAHDLGVRGEVQLLQGSEIVTPMTWGIFRPTILLPRAARGWTAEQRRDVVLHELAHVKRRDCLTQALAQLACALFWFNPLVWIAAAQMRMERERACDDQVLLAGSKASSYASHLLEMARSLKPERCTSLASVAMARRSQLSDRLVAVLEPKSRRSPHPGLTWSTAVVALAAVLPLAALEPTTIDGEAVASEQGARHTARWVTPAPPEPPTPVVEAPRAYAFEVGGRDGVVALSEDGRAYVVDTDGRTVARVRPGTRVGIAPRQAVIVGDKLAYTAPFAVALADADGLEVTTSNDGQVVTADRTHWVHSDDGYGLSLEMDGELTFNDDFSDIVGMSDDAYFELEEKDGRHRRRVEMELGRDGEIERTYFVRGRETEFDDDAREWFEETLTHAVRTLGIGAKQRLGRIYERDGVQGVLDEIDAVDSDYARSRNYQAFLALEGVDRADVATVLKEATRNVDSDFELANLLISSLTEYMADDELREAYLEAAKSIDSDFEKRRVLSAALQDRDLEMPEMAAVLEATEDIDSDFEAGQLLRFVRPDHLADPGLRGSYFRAIGNLDSDFEQSRILSELLEGNHLDRDGMILVLESIEDIDSDFEAARLLTMAAEHYLDEDEEMRQLYFRAVADLDSDFERSRVLQHLMAEENLSAESQLLVLENIDEMDSDFEKTNLLVELADEEFASEEVREAYLRVVDGIDSDHEYGRAMKALRRSERDRDHEREQG